MTRPLLRVPGSKAKLAKRLIQMMPHHRQYVEVFGGTGVVLFHKPPSSVEVYNDLDSLHTNAFRVLQDDSQRAELLNLVAFTPDGREQYHECFEVLQREDESPVRKAWALVICCATGFCGTHPAVNRSWAVFKKWPPRTDLHLLSDTVRIWADRLLQVRIENGSWERLLQTYDGPDTFFFLDPPYHPETLRHGGLYRYEMSVDNHRRFLEAVVRLRGYVMLSGYEHLDYTEQLFHWRRVSFQTRAVVGAAWRGDSKRTEVVWMNYEADGSRAGEHKRLITRRFIETVGGLEEAKSQLAAVEKGQRLWKKQPPAHGPGGDVIEVGPFVKEQSES